MAELTLSELNGRFRLVDRPVALPGKCAICGAVNKPVVDFGLDVEFYGVVYICVEDMKAAAKILGMVEGNLSARAELVQRHHEQQLLAAKEISDEYIRRFTDLSDDFGRRLRGLSADTDEAEPATSDSDNGTESPADDATGGENFRPVDEGNFFVSDEGPVSVSGSNGDGSRPIFSV